MSYPIESMPMVNTALHELEIVVALMKSAVATSESWVSESASRYREKVCDLQAKTTEISKSLEGTKNQITHFFSELPT